MASLSLHRTERKREYQRGNRRIILSGALLFGVALWYLIAANAVVTASYRLSDVLAARAKLSQELEDAQATALAATSPEAIEARAQALGFHAIEHSQYLTVPGTAVAFR